MRAEGLGFAYQGSSRWALSRASLSADSGDEIWVTGPNAAGKSTLLGVLAGVMPAVIEGTLGAPSRSRPRTAPTLRVSVAPRSVRW